MKYKVAVENVATVHLVGQIAGSGSQVTKFKFTLTCNRLSQDALQLRLADKEEGLKDFMGSLTTAWDGQRLVLNEDDTPADFNADSFDVLMSIAGMPGYAFQAYLKAVAVKEKN